MKISRSRVGIKIYRNRRKNDFIFTTKKIRPWIESSLSRDITFRRHPPFQTLRRNCHSVPRTKTKNKILAIKTKRYPEKTPRVYNPLTGYQYLSRLTASLDGLTTPSALFFHPRFSTIVTDAKIEPSLVSWKKVGRREGMFSASGSIPQSPSSFRTPFRRNHFEEISSNSDSSNSLRESFSRAVYSK